MIKTHGNLEELAHDRANLNTLTNSKKHSDFDQTLMTLALKVGM
jgi:hypothetical protein